MRVAENIIYIKFYWQKFPEKIREKERERNASGEFPHRQQKTILIRRVYF